MNKEKLRKEKQIKSMLGKKFFYCLGCGKDLTDHKTLFCDNCKYD